MADEPLLIELDARGRASLGKLARHRRYLAHVEPDGKIVLTPARIVPAEEVAHLDYGKALAEVLSAEVQSGRSVARWTDPSDNIGPTGRGVTAAPYGDDESDEASHRDQIQDADDDRERMARAFWQDYASERDA